MHRWGGGGGGDIENKANKNGKKIEDEKVLVYSHDNITNIN